MKKAALPAVLVLAAVGIVGGLIFYMKNEYRLASMAPEGTTVWAEGQDFSGTWAAFKKHDAWKDFEKSKSFAEATKAWGMLVDMSEKHPDLKEWQELKIKLREELVLAVAGKNVAFGAIAGDGSAEPSIYAMTKIDVVALAKEILKDPNADWKKVWAKLKDLLGGKDAKVEAFEGYDIASREIIPEKLALHFCLVEDVVVTSHNKDTVKEIIKVKVGKAKALAGRDEFDGEVDELKSGKAAYAWIDMGFLTDKARVKKVVLKLADMAIDKAGAPKKFKEQVDKTFSGEELQLLIDDLKPEVKGLAVALIVPEGNPYLAYLEGSREANDIFKDNKKNDVRALVSDQTVGFLEAKGVYELIVGFSESKTIKKVFDSHAVKWIKTKLNDPDALGDFAPGGSKESPIFEARAGLAVIQAVAKELIGEDIAIAVEVDDDAKKMEDAIRPVLFLRPRPAVRMVLDIALGTMAAHKDKLPKAKVEKHGEHTVFSAQTGPMTGYLTRVGADFVLTNHKDLIDKVIDRADGKGEAQDAAFKKTITKLPEDYKAFAYINMDRYMKAVGHLLKGSKGGPGPSLDDAQFKRVMEAAGVSGSGAFAFYVDKDFTTYTLRTYQTLPEPIRGIYLNADPQPEVWNHMPVGTFISGTFDADPQKLYGYYRDLFKALAPSEDKFNEGMDAIKKALGGKDLEKDLVAHLGTSVGLAVTVQEKLVLTGATAEAAERTIAIPAALMFVKVKDEAAFKPVFSDLITRSVQSINEARAHGNEAAAQGALKTIQNAQQLFREADKDRNKKLDYADNLRALAMPGLIDWRLSSGKRQGYQFKMKRSTKEPEHKWMAIATPMGGRGRHFAVNQNGTIYHSWTPIELNDACEVPKGSKRVYEDLGPAPEGKDASGDPNDPSAVKIAKKAVDGTTIWTIIPPEKQQQESERTFGKGFSPCFAISSSYLIFATSETSLQQALAANGGANLASSAEFKRAIEGQPTKVNSFFHFGFSGLIDQIKQNGELIALNASQPGKALAKPERPKYPEVKDPKLADKAFKDFQEKSKLYQKARSEYRKRLKDWRKKNLSENLKVFNDVLDSLKWLGDIVGHGKVTDEKDAYESSMIYKINTKVLEK